MKKKVLPLILLLFSLILNIFLLLEKKAVKKNDTYKVKKVLDGDSFVIGIDEGVRLVNIDAPEIEYCYGKQAKQRLEELIKGKDVELVEERVGQMGRPLVFAYLDGQLINKLMVEEGYARYRPLKTEHKQIIKKADSEAREKEIGIWSSKCRQTTNPENPECSIKGNIEIRSKEKRYFYPGCTNYSKVIVEKDIGDRWFCTQAEARQAGFVKSGDCPD